MSSVKRTTVLLWAGLLVCTRAGALQLSPEVLARASKVVEALKTAEAGRSDASSPSPGSLVFTEEEFNAYVAYELDAAKEEFVKEIVLKLLDQNQVEGKILIDLGGRKGTESLPSRLEFFFKAGFESRAGTIRIDMTSLFLGTQRLPVGFIDTVIAVVSRIQGFEPTSLSDWYGLPYGIGSLETRQGRLLVHY